MIDNELDLLSYFLEVLVETVFTFKVNVTLTFALLTSKTIYLIRNITGLVIEESLVRSFAFISEGPLSVTDELLLVVTG